MIRVTVWKGSEGYPDEREEEKAEKVGEVELSAGFKR